MYPAGEYPSTVGSEDNRLAVDNVAGSRGFALVVGGAQWCLSFIGCPGWDRTSDRRVIALRSYSPIPLMAGLERQPHSWHVQLQIVPVPA